MSISTDHVITGLGDRGDEAILGCEDALESEDCSPRVSVNCSWGAPDPDFQPCTVRTVRTVRCTVLFTLPGSDMVVSPGCWLRLAKTNVCELFG